MSDNNRFKVPVAIFDANKVNTSFIYKPQASWPENDYKLFIEEIKQVVTKLIS